MKGARPLYGLLFVVKLFFSCCKNNRKFYVHVQSNRYTYSELKKSAQETMNFKVK